jgi:transposase-like protein
VDQDGDVLDILVQKHRDKRTAPRRIVTDKLRSYSAARKEVMPDVSHDNDRWQNNRAEVSHQPTRQQERQRRRFKSPGQAQRFVIDARIHLVQNYALNLYTKGDSKCKKLPLLNSVTMLSVTLIKWSEAKRYGMHIS